MHPRIRKSRPSRESAASHQSRMHKTMLDPTASSLSRAAAARQHARTLPQTRSSRTGATLQTALAYPTLRRPARLHCLRLPHTRPIAKYTRLPRVGYGQRSPRLIHSPCLTKNSEMLLLLRIQPPFECFKFTCDRSAYVCAMVVGVAN